MNHFFSPYARVFIAWVWKCTYRHITSGIEVEEG